MPAAGAGVKSCPTAPHTQVGSALSGRKNGPVVAAPDHQKVLPNPADVEMVKGTPGSTSAPTENLPFRSVKVCRCAVWSYCTPASGDGTQEPSGSCMSTVPVTVTPEYSGPGAMGSSTILAGYTCAAVTLAVADDAPYCESPKYLASTGAGTTCVIGILTCAAASVPTPRPAGAAPCPNDKLAILSAI